MIDSVRSMFCMRKLLLAAVVLSMGFKLFWRICSITVLTITALVFAGHWAGPTLAQRI